MASLIARTTLDAVERRQQLRDRLARLEEVKRLLDVETIQTDYMYEPALDHEGKYGLEGAMGEPVVIYWSVVDRWIEAAIDEVRHDLRAAEAP